MDTYTYERLLAWSTDRLRSWQQDALRRVLQGKTTDDDYRALADLAISDVVGADSPQPQPADATHVRPSGDSLPTVSLLGLREIERVNALGPGPIEFAETGLTVVYGDNGSEKTGFSRILKRACRARVPGPTIRGSVFQPPSLDPAKATIEFALDGTSDSTAWVDGTPTLDELALLTVFDDKCASWQVDRPSVIEYTPELLAVFRDLAMVFRNVESVLLSKKARLPQRPALLSELAAKLPTGTAARTFVDGLSAISDRAELDRLAAFSQANETRAAELAQVLSGNPGAEARVEEDRGRRIAELESRCQALATLVSDAGCEALTNEVQEESAAATAAEAARAVLDRESNLDGVGTDAWRTLWEAARSYSEQVAVPGQDFPVLSDGADCVLCQQPLGENAIRRFRSFEDFVKGEVQQRHDNAKMELQSTVAQLNSLEVPRRSSGAINEVGLANTDIGREVRLFLISVKRRCRHLLRLASGYTGEPRPPIPDVPSFDAVRSEIAARVRLLDSAAQEESRSTLAAEQAELTARSELAAYRQDVADEIARLGLVAILDAAQRECNTHKVTLEQGLAEMALVASRLQDRFRANLIDIGFSEIQIDVQPQGGEQGVRPYGYQVTADPSTPAGEVLSEGERTCVALAGILAELEITENRSGIVLDDPVCSLDHNYRRRIASRLAAEAKIRQIVVFTHDVTFLFLLEHYAGIKGVALQPVTILRGGTEGGHGNAESAPPWETMTIRERISRLRRDLVAARAADKEGNSPEYERQARAIYGNLRESWERAVEEILLNETVLRFGQAVQTQRLRLIADDVKLSDVESIDEQMGYCSPFMHDPPGNVSRERPPGPDVVEADIKKLDDWGKEVRKRRKKKR